MNFSSLLIKWYSIHKRELPWRKTKDPYKIWLSETILQQTRVDQGLSYYLNFIDQFPTVFELANASEDEVLKLWQGLGFYSRARNLHQTAKVLVDVYNGNFPEQYENIKALKGVGDYTAAAIMSFCFNKPYAVVDGNVYRVLARIYGLTTPIDSTPGKKEFNQLANELLDKKRPADHNQAIMEFGAIHCSPKKPDCTNCIFNDNCIALADNSIYALPVKTNRIKQRNRYFNYLVIRTNTSYYLQKRTTNDIWKNLYEFPLIETDKQASVAKLEQDENWRKLIGAVHYTIRNSIVQKKHVLSHQNIFAKFWEIEVTNNDFLVNKKWIKVNSNKLASYAVPKLIENYLMNNL